MPFALSACAAARRQRARKELGYGKNVGIGRRGCVKTVQDRHFDGPPRPKAVVFLSLKDDILWNEWTAAFLFIQFVQISAVVNLKCAS